MRSPTWPREIKSGAITVKIYRLKHKETASGFIYHVTYPQPGSKPYAKQFANPDRAIEHAEEQVDALAAGRIEIAGASRDDLAELSLLKALAGEVPVLSAMREWRAARDLVGGAMMQACEEWSKKHATSSFLRGKIEQVIDDFIAAKNAAGKDGSRTYGAKLKPYAVKFKGRELTGIKAEEIQLFLNSIPDGVTRNDIRKRGVTLWRWARNNNRLPRKAELEIELTERAIENDTDIGILDPAYWADYLAWVLKNYPNTLAAAVLAGFCGLRVDEVHGKKKDNRKKRQLWEDVFPDEGYVIVSNAKINTPAWRHAPLCPAAVAWLKLCPGDHKGPVCEPGALEILRIMSLRAKWKLPENGLRHSFISYRIPVVDGNKSQVSTEAGNSVGEIDRRYRRPRTKAQGLAWFGVMPASSA